MCGRWEKVPGEQLLCWEEQPRAALGEGWGREEGTQVFYLPIYFLHLSLVVLYLPVYGALHLSVSPLAPLMGKGQPGSAAVLRMLSAEQGDLAGTARVRPAGTLHAAPVHGAAALASS